MISFAWKSKVKNIKAKIYNSFRASEMTISLFWTLTDFCGIIKFPSFPRRVFVATEIATFV